MPLMSRHSRPAPERATDPVLARYARQYQVLKDALTTLGYFCKGTVGSRTFMCGRAACPCHRDSARRHGPYFEWTYKVAGKTVYHRLSPQEARIYKEGAAEYRRLKVLLRRLENLSRRALAHMARRT